MMLNNLAPAGPYPRLDIQCVEAVSGPDGKLWRPRLWVAVWIVGCLPEVTTFDATGMPSAGRDRPAASLHGPLRLSELEARDDGTALEPAAELAHAAMIARALAVVPTAAGGEG